MPPTSPSWSHQISCWGEMVKKHQLQVPRDTTHSFKRRDKRSSSLVLLHNYILRMGKTWRKEEEFMAPNLLITITVKGGEKSSIHKHRLWNKHHYLCLIWINFWLNPTFHWTRRKCNLRVLSLTSVVCHSSGILQSVNLSRVGVSRWPLRHVQSRSMRGHGLLGLCSLYPTLAQNSLSRLPMALLPWCTIPLGSCWPSSYFYQPPSCCAWTHSCLLSLLTLEGTGFLQCDSEAPN